MEELPGPLGFKTFILIGEIAVFLNIIYFFGFLQGILIGILVFFQLPFYTFLWVFNIPTIKKLNQNISYFVPVKPNISIYSSLPYITCSLYILFFVNIFFNNFSYLKLMEYNYMWEIISLILLGNFLRILTFKFLIKPEKNY